MFVVRCLLLVAVLFVACRGVLFVVCCCLLCVVVCCSLLCVGVCVGVCSALRVVRCGCSSFVVRCVFCVG